MDQWWQEQLPIDADNPNEAGIMNAAKTRLQALDQQHNYSGTSTDLYQFSYDPTNYWNPGKIFHANTVGGLSFEGAINALDDNNQSEALFRVEEASEQSKVEDIMARSLRMKHPGIFKPSVGGYNEQIGKVVWGFTAPTGVRRVTLENWLKARTPGSTSIPPEVQDLLRTAYQAIVKIWEGCSTSDYLASASTYHMIDDKVKIDPLRIRRRNGAENDEMLPRKAFGTMILECIKPVWNDVELDDFIDLLKNPNAGAMDILQAPVLLPPARRELMYHKFEKKALSKAQLEWLTTNANPQAGWKERASNEDKALKKLIKFQAKSGGFPVDFLGASRFASKSTAHYTQHFRDTAEGQSGVITKGRVDSLLKQVLPGLLTKCYNSQYAPWENEAADEAAVDPAAPVQEAVDE